MRNLFSFRKILIPYVIVSAFMFFGFYQAPQKVKVDFHSQHFTKDSQLIEDYWKSYFYHWRKSADYDSMYFYASKFNKLAEKVVKESPKDSLFYAYYVRSINNVAWSDLNRGRYEGLLDSAEKAKNLAIERFGDSSLVLLSIYIGYNAYYAAKGEYGKALEQLEKALRITKIHYGEKALKTASAFWNLGLLSEKKGDFELATYYYQKAANLFILNNREQDATKCFDRIGSFHQWNDEYELAIENFEKSLNIRTKVLDAQSEHLIFNYLRLAAVYLEMDNVKKAEEYFSLTPSFKNLESVKREHLNLESNYSELGDIYLNRKEFEKANSYYSKLFELVKYYRGANHVALAEVYNKIGKLHLAKNEPDIALKAFQNALKTLLIDFQTDDVTQYPSLRRIGVGFTLPTTLTYKANAFKIKYQQSEDINNLKHAMEGYLLASDFIDLMRSEYLTEASKETLAERARSIYKNGIDASLELFEKTKDEKYINQALELMEKSKSILLLEAIQKSKANQFSGLSDELLSKEQRIKTDLAFYEKLLFEEEKKSDSDRAKIDEYYDKIFVLRQKYDDLIAQIKTNHPEYYQLKYDLEVADILSIQSTLSDKSVLVEYFLSDDILWSLGITRDEVFYNKFEVDTDFLNKLETFTYLLRNHPNPNESASQIRNDYSTFVNYSSELYNILLAPIIEKTDLTNLIIIPDGQLGYLPFQILLSEKPEAARDLSPDFRNLPYLMVDYEINYEYSSSILLTKPSNKKGKNIYAGFAPAYDENELLARRSGGRGDVIEVYDEAVRKSLAPLKYNQPEVEYSNQAMKGKSFLSTEATEQAFKSNADDSKILHLAMHALTNDTKPLYSQLIFSESIGSSEDGNLHAYELYNMRLNADLAVLSACNTGTGKLQRGEGIMSLARAFKYAGCPNIVTSLWKANDKTTKDIIVAFFQNLKNGEGKSKALKNAKKTFLGTCDQQFTHPYYWATFVLIGDNEPINFGNSKWKLALTGFTVLGFLFIVFGMVKRQKAA